MVRLWGNRLFSFVVVAGCRRVLEPAGVFDGDFISWLGIVLTIALLEKFLIDLRSHCYRCGVWLSCVLRRRARIENREVVEGVSR